MKRVLGAHDRGSVRGCVERCIGNDDYLGGRVLFRCFRICESRGQAQLRSEREGCEPVTATSYRVMIGKGLF